MEVIVGIDPGTTFCGWAMLSLEDRLVASGCISASSKLSGYKPRMINIANTLEGILFMYSNKGVHVVHAGIESQFVKLNKKTVLALSQATGALIMSIYRSSGVIADDIAPESAKKIMHIKSSSYLNMEKSEKRKAIDAAMKEAVYLKYGKEVKKPDEAFAIAIARATLSIYKSGDVEIAESTTV